MEQSATTKCFLKEGPLISVIVPVYNVEKYLERCVDSILTQTYENLEVILVDDGSQDNSAAIIQTYLARDERIKSVQHDKNRGLFQARISGVEKATGKYIAFVDSDDYISVDWFRALVKKAEAVCSDITVGEWCFDYESGGKVYCNLDPFRVKDFSLEGSDVLDAFMAQAGRSYSWTVVWNKLYLKELWDKVYPYFSKFSESHGHMLMWEDIAFSSGLWSRANRITNVHNINYFYFKSKDASTSLNHHYARNRKYIQDSAAAMQFMKQMLMETGTWQSQERNFNKWMSIAASIVYQDLVIDLKKGSYESIIREAFGFYEEFEERSLFFYHLQTPLQPSFDWYDDIKREIVSSKTKFVSFDVFDTLVQRPFFYPADLFSQLTEKLNELTSAYIDFTRIRVDAESQCRKKNTLFSPSKEDITLDEIYDTIAENYRISKEILSELKNEEVQLEFKYCYQRKVGKEFFELARDAGKEIIACSDMYLPKEVIAEILNKNGYKGYKHLYLSSELGQTKVTKNLYQYVLQDLSCTNSSAIIHIGDNWASDIENAGACGLRCGHICKATDMLQNLNPGIYSGEIYSRTFQWNPFKEDNLAAMNGFTGLRNVLAQVANRIFDNPYVSYHPDSDFNANPHTVGYLALGPHLLALCNFIFETAKKESIPTIHFVARDGYLVKRAFDALNQTQTKSNYIRLSRKSLLLADVERTEDLYSLFRKANVLNCTPKDLQNYLSPIIPDEQVMNIPNILRANSLYYDRTFKTGFEYEKCMKVFIEKVIDLSLLVPFKAKLREYFSTIISPGDYIFDVGYSGRPEAALSNVLGYPVGSLYIHVNSDVATIRQRRYDCPSYCFYDYKPCITGVMREHLLMELGPSTVGYQELGGNFSPVLEVYKASYESDFVTQIVQDAALEFIRDYCEIFADCRNKMILPGEALSALFEYYLHYSKPIDRRIFSTLTFEDALGEGKTFNALEFWNREIEVHGLNQDQNGNAGYTETVPAGFSDLYRDGLFVKLYQRINRWAPKGSQKRELIKKFAKIFIH